MRDDDFITFQDAFYDLLEKYGVKDIDQGHPRFNEICFLRNKVSNLIDELNGEIEEYKSDNGILADSIYFEFMNYLDDSTVSEFIEIDPDNHQGTRNTEKGTDLYYSIEDKIKEARI